MFNNELKTKERKVVLICIESSFDFQFENKEGSINKEKETDSWESHKEGTWDDHHGQGESASNQDHIHIQKTENCH